MPKPWEMDWSGVKTPSAAPARPKPTPQDMIDLMNAQSHATAERDAAREYQSAAQAVHDMGTGPWKATWLDAITPDEDDSYLGRIGSIIGAPFRALVSDKTLAARDHLKTINAKVALQGSQQMKGSSSDKDTALMRMAGVGPYKTEAENDRIIQQAERDSQLEGLRAQAKANWIGRFGSLAQPAPNGVTFQQHITNLESNFGRPKAAIPTAPPSVRSRPTKRVTIDLNGNPI